MIIKEYLKFTLFSKFTVIRVRKTANLFEIKRLKSEVTPVWVVWYSTNNKDTFSMYYDWVRPKSIDITKGLSTQDMNTIQQQGFRLLRPCDTPCICIKERKPSGRWFIVEWFRTKNERSYRIKELADQKDVFIAD